MSDKPNGAASPATILLAVTGMSPAVLTETVWALAHPADRACDRIIPDRVIALTTTRGAREIEEQLFGSDRVWDALRQSILGSLAAKGNALHFGATPDCVKVFTRKIAGKSIPLDDLSTEAENAAVADCITDELWAHVEKPDTRLVASISGGFKTMSALLFAGMSLLGRRGDLITHVLVNAPFDTRLEPRFFFPAQPRKVLRDAAGNAFRAAKAQLRLGFVPFVPLNDLLEKYQKPRSYSDLVAHCRGSLDRHLRQPVKLRLSIPNRQVCVNQTAFTLPPQPFLFLWFLASQVRAGCVPLGKYVEALEPFAAFARDVQGRWAELGAPWAAKGKGVLPAGFDSAVVTHDEAPIRTKLLYRITVAVRRVPGAAPLAAYLPQAGRCSLELGPDDIEIQDVGGRPGSGLSPSKGAD